MPLNLRIPAALALLVATLAAAVSAQEPLRFATWNVEGLASPGSGEWLTALDVLARIDADVVAIQEVFSPAEAAALPIFGAQAGHAHAAVSQVSGTLSGNLYNAVISKHPILFSDSRSAADLSGDPAANDITRDVFEVHVQLPNAAERLGIFVVHLKANTGGTNDFRRAIEIARLRQAIDAFQAAFPAAPFIVCGDLNEDLGDGPFGAAFFALPGGLPASYQLGADIVFPVVYDPFVQLGAEGAVIADATQEDSTVFYATRPSSGRRLDYVMYGNGVALVGDEVYNADLDNGIDDGPIGNWLPKAGLPLPAGTVQATSDHFPVFADLLLPSLVTALYPGTADDFAMATSTGGPLTAGLGADVKTAAPGDLLTVFYESPNGGMVGFPNQALVIADFFDAPNVPPAGLTAGMWFDLVDPIVLHDDTLAPGGFPGVVSPFGNYHSFAVPSGLAGQQAMIQCVVVSPLALNGFVGFSDGHRIDFTP